MTDLSRYDDWLAWLREQGESDPDVEVVFVGGSAVTGQYDDHSDLDVEVLPTPGEAAAAYRRLLDAALRDFEVHQVWELPESTWPDGRQAFLNLTPDAGDMARPTRIIDLHVSDLADEHRLVDERRHGVPHVVHDPQGLVELRHDDEDEMARARSDAVAQAAARRQTAQPCRCCRRSRRESPYQQGAQAQACPRRLRQRPRSSGRPARRSRVPRPARRRRRPRPQGRRSVCS